MSDDRQFIPGDFYRQCDRTGFKVRARRSRKQWDGLIVRAESWEPRHPQDFVRGVADMQSVPEPRPPASERYIQIPVLLMESGLTVGYGPVLQTEDGGLFYTADNAPSSIEIGPVYPQNYPKSA